MTNVMVDIETIGSTPGCAILSIAAVEFNPDTAQLGKEFSTGVHLQSCLDYGLKVEGETFYWWIQQSVEARSALSKNRCTLSTALRDFSSYLVELRAASNDKYCIWSHGSSFDLAVLYRPWQFRNERDTRTVLDLAGMKMPKTELSHDALVDAKSQAITIMGALKKLKHHDT
jgi:hypothetical protein